jgi:glycosyltransferase involved in cell wall biosynthesis
MPPSIAVVIPTYNRSEHVRLAIDSALAQTLPCTEIVVVDDGSTDDTAQVLAAYGDRITSLRQQNQGAAAARNAGIRAANSEWIAFCDSDDELEASRLADFAHDLERWPDLVAHCGNAEFRDGGRMLHDWLSLRGRQANGVSHRLDRPLSLHMEMQFLTPTFTVRRDALLAEGGFPSHVRLFEDFHLMTRIALRGPWVWTEKPLARVFRRGPPASNTFLDMPDKALQMGLSLADVYGTLLARAEPDAGERRVAATWLSSSLADIGDALRCKGEYRRAMASYARSVHARPSARSLVRAALGCTIGPTAVAWLRGRARPAAG